MNQLNTCITQADCLPENMKFHHRIVLKSLKFKKESQQITGKTEEFKVNKFQFFYFNGMHRITSEACSCFKENRIQSSENGKLRSLVEQKQHQWLTPPIYMDALEFRSQNVHIYLHIIFGSGQKRCHRASAAANSSIYLLSYPVIPSSVHQFVAQSFAEPSPFSFAICYRG